MDRAEWFYSLHDHCHYQCSWYVYAHCNQSCQRLYGHHEHRRCSEHFGAGQPVGSQQHGRQPADLYYSQH